MNKFDSKVTEIYNDLEIIEEGGPLIPAILLVGRAGSLIKNMLFGSRLATGLTGLSVGVEVKSLVKNAKEKDPKEVLNNMPEKLKTSMANTYGSVEKGLEKLLETIKKNPGASTAIIAATLVLALKAKDIYNYFAKNRRKRNKEQALQDMKRAANSSSAI